jgi:MoxR-like ATPase
MMSYTKLFDPGAAPKPRPRRPAGETGDHRDGLVYVYTPEIELAVNVALATRRPLLVRGPSGGGKSSLARHVSRVLGWRYYEKVISSRTQAQDLLWEIDHLRRLQDAQAKSLDQELSRYLRPGILWWAFDEAGARQQAERMQGGSGKPLDPNLGEEHDRAVVLLDEIDKADPDVPNNLLVPLGSFELQVEGRSEPVRTAAARSPLVFITTNDERDLPNAFLRRCVELVLRPPDLNRLVAIGGEHFPKVPTKRLEQIAEIVLAGAAGEKATPSAAEYLDTVRACLELKVQPGSPAWDDLLKVTVWKHGRSAGKPTGAA